MIWKVLVLVAALPVLLVLLVLSALVLALMPPLVSSVAAGVFALFVVWLVVRRRGGGLVPGSESAIMGRQSSKAGLL